MPRKPGHAAEMQPFFVRGFPGSTAMVMVHWGLLSWARAASAAWQEVHDASFEKYLKTFRRIAICGRLPPVCSTMRLSLCCCNSASPVVFWGAGGLEKQSMHVLNDL